jgi:hypothetical protein
LAEGPAASPGLKTFLERAGAFKTYSGKSGPANERFGQLQASDLSIFMFA